MTLTVLTQIEAAAQQLQDAGVFFGHGTTNAFDEAAWLVLWKLNLPLETDLEGPDAQTVLTANEQEAVRALIAERIQTRKPAAYLTQQAWLQGVPFYIDERSIVPRSLIAELIADGSLDVWLSEDTKKVLDVCTGNGSLAVLCAMAWPEVQVDAIDISTQALEVAAINVNQHALQTRITLIESDGLAQVSGQYDLIVCNPPYVNAQSMAELPQEYLQEPELALAGGSDGMDFIRGLLARITEHMTENAVLVLEIGNERAYFEAAFPDLPTVWLDTSAGDSQVLLLERDAIVMSASVKG